MICRWRRWWSRRPVQSSRFPLWSWPCRLAHTVFDETSQPENQVATRSPRDVCREASSRRRGCLTTPSVHLWSSICVRCSDPMGPQVIWSSTIFFHRTLSAF
ncbi:hypothetical protein SEVIR_7G309200v4 [Setaria viridis]|uniref:Uncharacterized protein n=2 Tax=Setaria TaxID=4554 RepID=A0A368S2T3_SETIT|nr:hypothetical protein SETIT_7G297500v2 [Setaria italica]TKW07467.1 hypothetical protein SEVIR_7G309200v2 [Setaria viridis]